MIGSPWLVLAAVLVYGLAHSWLASRGVKARIYNRFGARAYRIYRLLYNLFALVSFLPILFLVWRLPDRTLYAVPFPWFMLCLAGQFAAALMLLVGLLQTDIGSFLGLRQLFQDSPDEQQTLVVHGLYRYVRHPLYTAGLVFIWLTPVMTANLLAMNVGLTFYIILGAWFEERKLLAEYGAAYAEYRAATPMLLPRPRWFDMHGKKSRKA